MVLLAASAASPAVADHGDGFHSNRTADWPDDEGSAMNATDGMNGSAFDGNLPHIDLANGTVENATVARRLAEELDDVSAADLLTENGTVRRNALRNLTAEEAEAIATRSDLAVNASVLLALDTDPERTARQESAAPSVPTADDARGDADSTAGVVLEADVAPADGRMGLTARLMPGVSMPMAATSLGSTPLAVDRTESATARDVSSSTGGTAAQADGDTSTPPMAETSDGETGGSNDETVESDEDGGDGTPADATPTEPAMPSDGTNATSTLLGGPATTIDGLLGSGAPLAPASLFAMSLLTVVTRPWIGFVSTGAVLLGDWLARFGVFFRFGRSDSTDPLEHETRAEIHEHLQKAPGTSLTELSESLDVPLSTLRHHLKVLEREREIVSHKQRNRRRFYPRGAENEALTAALAGDTSADIIEALRQHGAATVGEVVDVVDRSYSTVSHHLTRLAEEGVIVQQSEGRQTISRLDPSVESQLESTAEAESTDFGRPNGEATAD